jgi:hypothetical protein
MPFLVLPPIMYPIYPRIEKALAGLDTFIVVRNRSPLRAVCSAIFTMSEGLRDGGKSEDQGSSYGGTQIEPLAGWEPKQGTAAGGP